MMRIIHYEKDDYPGYFQLEALCGFKEVFCNDSVMTQDEERVTCEPCLEQLK